MMYKGPCVLQVNRPKGRPDPRLLGCWWPHIRPNQQL